MGKKEASLVIETVLMSDDREQGAGGPDRPRYTRYIDASASFAFQKPAEHECRLACMTCFEAYDMWRQQRFSMRSIRALLVEYDDKICERATRPWPKHMAFLSDIQVATMSLAGDACEGIFNYDLAKLGSEDGELLPGKIAYAHGLEPVPLVTMHTRVVVNAFYHGGSDADFVNTVGRRKIGMRFIISGTMLTPPFPSGLGLGDDQARVQ